MRIRTLILSATIAPLLALVFPIATFALCSPVAQGGTGSCSIATADILFGNGTSPIATSSVFTYTTASSRLNFTNASSTNITISGILVVTPLGTPSGTLLAADPNGKLIATSTPVSGVSSVTGTTNQITASPTSGAVILTIPSIFSISAASTTQLSVSNGSATSTIYGQATSTFGAGISATYLNLSGSTASSTAANGFNITKGCYAVNGTCLSSGGTGTVTNIATTYPITGGPITTTGTLALAFGTTTSNTWANTQTFTNPIVVGAGTSTFGALQGTYINLTGTSATSTIGNGFSIANGCYAVNGACLTAGSIGGGSTQGVNWATTAVLAGTPTYSNGTSGVGATLTEVGTGALSVDGNAPAAGDRVLVKNQASGFQNGIYSVTVTGSGIASYVLTRATDYNAPVEITPGITTYVVSGTANNDSTWAVSFTSPPLVIGTNTLTYTEVSGGGAAVASVSNGDSTLTFSPTTGAVIGSLNLSHANTWLAAQTLGTNLLIATSPKIITGINDTNGNQIAALSATASAVNAIRITNAASGNAPMIDTTNTSDLLLSGNQGFLRITGDGTGASTDALSLFGSSGANPILTPVTTNRGFQINSNGTGSLLLNPSNSGKVGIASSTPGTLLSLGSSGNYINLDNTATSSFAKGINIAAGCFSIGGTCIGSSAVSSVSNADGTLTISPTSGAVVASLNLSHPNTWLYPQTFNFATTSTALLMVGTSTTFHPSASPTATSIFSSGSSINATPNQISNSISSIFIGGGQSGGAGVNTIGAYGFTTATPNSTASQTFSGLFENVGGSGSNDSGGDYALYVNQRTAFSTAHPNFALYSTGGVNHLDGNVQIGATTTAGTLLNLNGVANIGTATSTFYSTGGINLAGGCFAIGGTCLTSGGSGTVTSVSASVPSAFSISGSPITTSGTLAITYSGTALPIANGGTGLTSIGASSTVAVSNGSALAWQKLDLASTVYGVLPIVNGGTNATSFTQSGGILAYDGTREVNFSGYTLTASLLTAANASTTNFSVNNNEVSGERYPVWSYATSTAWTGTTTIDLLSPFSNGTLKNIVCLTSAGTLNVQILVNSTNISSMFNASTTKGTVTFSGSNTFTRADDIKAQFGTPATSPTSITCTGVATGY